MPRHKNFINRDVRPQSATESDFEALFARHGRQHRTEPADIPVDRIQPNPFQARHTFTGIDELAQAIRIQGFTSRLRVRRDPHDATRFQLVFGERRLRAAKEAGLATIPCEIAEHSDEELIEIGLAENIQRQDLDPLEEAQAFRAFMDQRGYTIARLAERIGKDRSYVESRVALLRTPEDVQQMVARRPDTIRAAREIAKLPTEAERRTLIDGVLAGTLSKEDVRSLVRETTEHVEDEEHASGSSPQAENSRRRTLSPSLEDMDQRLERDFRRLRMIVSGWESALPGLHSAQRAKILRVIEEHLADLERVTNMLRKKR